MKKFSLLIALTAILSACTTRLALPQDPADIEGGDVVSVIYASVQPLILADEGGVIIPGEMQWTWPEQAVLGVYGSEKGSNEPYRIRSSYEGTSSEAVFYGPEVAGSLSAYMPWKKEGAEYAQNGKAGIPPVQKSYDNPYENILNNLEMAATAEGARLVFGWPAGLARISCNISTKGRKILSVRLTSPDADLCSGGKSVVVEGIGLPASVESPVTFHAVLLPGVYSGIMATMLLEDGKSVSRPLAGDIRIESCTVSDASVSDETFGYGNSDLEGEDIIYD